MDTHHLPDYDLNDLHSDMGHLAHLVETIADTILNDCAFVAPGDKEGGRLPGMDRLNGLIWIARDMANALDAKISDHFQEIGSTCNGREKVIRAA